MRIRIVKIGRVAYPEITALAAMYAKRVTPLARPLQIEGHELKDEGPLARLLLQPATSHLVYALDERGERWDSPAFASRLQKLSDDPAIKSLTLIVGGPLGLSPALRAQADLTLSLSQLTLTSDMAWLLLWEQL